MERGEGKQGGRGTRPQQPLPTANEKVPAETGLWKLTSCLRINSILRTDVGVLLEARRAKDSPFT